MELNEILHTAMMCVNNARSKHNAGKIEGTKICLRDLAEMLQENAAALEEEPEAPAEVPTAEAEAPAAEVVGGSQIGEGSSWEEAEVPAE